MAYGPERMGFSFGEFPCVSCGFVVVATPRDEVLRCPICGGPVVVKGKAIDLA